jgi:FG-GAP repeat
MFQYNATDNVWIQLGFDLDGEALFDYFGTAVSLSANGRVVTVGATGSNANGDNSGHLRVFEYHAEQASWNPVGSTIVGPFPFAEAGMSVALSANGEVIMDAQCIQL